MSSYWVTWQVHGENSSTNMPLFGYSRTESRGPFPSEEEAREVGRELLRYYVTVKIKRNYSEEIDV